MIAFATKYCERRNRNKCASESDIYKKCPHKRIMKAKIPAKSVSKENKAT